MGVTSNGLVVHVAEAAAASGPHWTAFVSALALPLIAGIGAWIAFRQSQIARNKLKLDLYEKRTTIYEAVRKTLGRATSHGRLTQEEEIEYLSAIQDAQWLYGPEVAVYLKETLWHKIVDFGLHNAMSSSPHEPERVRHIHSRAETIKWLMAQHSELEKLFKPYLTLTH